MSIHHEPPGGGGVAGSGTTYQYKFDRTSTTAAAYVTILDVAGPGHIYHLQFTNVNAPTGSDHFKLTIDGYVHIDTIASTGNKGVCFDIFGDSGHRLLMHSASGGFGVYTTPHFKNQFKLEIKSDGTVPITTKVHYATG